MSFLFQYGRPKVLELQPHRDGFLLVVGEESIVLPFDHAEHFAAHIQSLLKDPAILRRRAEIKQVDA